MEAGMLLAGRYRLDRPIGTGGMGQVWAAHDSRLGRDVAIKVQQFDPAGDEVAFERFQQEAQSTAGLQLRNRTPGTDGRGTADATKTVIGSAPYLSPEQSTGDPADERSDLYALGCVMTTMLTERPPFDGEHPLTLMHQHVNAPPPQLSERRPGINPALEALVAQLLSKSPQDRP